MLKKLSVLFALIVGLFLFTLAPAEKAHAAAGDVRADIHGPSVNHSGVFVGSAFQVDVVADDISDPNGLAGGSFDLDFDETILSVHPTAPNDPQIGSTLADNGCSFESNEAVAGVLSVAFTCTVPEDITVATNVVLATIIFEQNLPVVAVDTPVVFDVLNPFLNDGTTPTPVAIDTPLNGVLGTTATIYVGTCGDQDGNDIINTIDATIDAFFFAGIIGALTEEQLVLSDVVRDNAINVGDVVAVLQDIVGFLPITDCGPVDPLSP